MASHVIGDAPLLITFYPLEEFSNGAGREKIFFQKKGIVGEKFSLGARVPFFSVGGVIYLLEFANLRIY